MSTAERGTTPPPRSTLATFFLAVLDDVTAALEVQVVRAPHRARAVGTIVVAGVVSWWIYVPIHELLHALGCALSGGTVSELQIAPEYGGALLACVLPFVVSGGDYAGRLSGFDTHGSDLVYLATDALPFALSIFPGVALLKRCAARGHPLRFGVGFVLALAPFYSLLGDYYEMGSVLATRAATLATGSGDLVFKTLRADDLAKLVGTLWSQPEELQLHDATRITAAAVLIVVGFAVGLLLACATYAAGARLARRA